MALFPLEIPPGVYRNGTNYQSIGRWHSAAFMRWFEKTLRPFGGWVSRATGMVGSARGAISWRPSNISVQALFCTPNHVYRWDGDLLLNITPEGLEPGVEDSLPGAGFGAGPFGHGPFGAPNPDITNGDAIMLATVWSLDTWGDHVLLINNTDRVLREYKNDDQPPATVENAPNGRAVFVTAERNAVLLGADGDLRRIQWSDYENNTIWTPDADNAAGDWRFQTTGILQAGARLRGTHLIWTTEDVWRMDHIGGVLVYRIELLAKDCGLVSPRAFAVVDDGAVWMGRGTFFIYAGGAVRPLECDIRDYVFRDINWTQQQKFFAGRIAQFGEVLFFYCSSGSNIVNRCVSYNVLEGHWNIVDPYGSMQRGAWIDAVGFPRPLAASDSGVLYEHEAGWTADGTPLTTQRFVESGPIQLDIGGRILEATQLIPDQITSGPVQLRFAQRFTPTGAVFDRGPYTGSAYTAVRLTGRQVAMRIEPTADEDFRIGKYRLEAREGGRR